MINCKRYPCWEPWSINNKIKQLPESRNHEAAFTHLSVMPNSFDARNHRDVDWPDGMLYGQRCLQQTCWSYSSRLGLGGLVQVNENGSVFDDDRVCL